MVGFGSTCFAKEHFRSYALTFAALALALVLPAGMVFGQASHGLISGRVIDQQSSSIPGATVTVTNQLTTARQIAQTDTSGYFVFPEVLPGKYTLTAVLLRGENELSVE